MNKAIENGTIPPENINKNDLGDIANVVLMGQESANKKLNEIGWKIIREISKNERAPTSTPKDQEANKMRSAGTGATTATGN